MSVKIRMLAVDVDGTLVCRGVLTGEDAAALHEAARAGIIVCLCTGRSWPEVKGVWDDLKLPPPHGPIICVGGALVAEPDTGRTLYSRSFERAVADELAQDFRRRGYPVMLLVDAWREGFDYYIIGSYDDRPLYHRFYDGRPFRIRYVQHIDDNCVRPLRVSVLEEPQAAEELVRAMRAKFAERIEVQSIFAPNYGVHIVEAFADSANKFTGLSYAGQAYRIAPAAMAAIGDDHNDLAMLRGTGLSATTSDAPPELRDAAGAVLAARGQNPVAAFVRMILEHNGSSR